MIHYVNTTVSPADLHAAANDAGLTVSQFEAKAINDAVEAYKRRKAAKAALMTAFEDTLGVVPGGD